MWGVGRRPVGMPHDGRAPREAAIPTAVSLRLDRSRRRRRSVEAHADRNVRRTRPNSAVGLPFSIEFTHARVTPTRSASAVLVRVNARVLSISVGVRLQGIETLRAGAEGLDGLFAGGLNGGVQPGEDSSHEAEEWRE